MDQKSQAIAISIQDTLAPDAKQRGPFRGIPLICRLDQVQAVASQELRQPHGGKRVLPEAVRGREGALLSSKCVTGWVIY